MTDRFDEIAREIIVAYSKDNQPGAIERTAVTIAQAIRDERALADAEATERAAKVANDKVSYGATEFDSGWDSACAAIAEEIGDKTDG